MKKFHILSAIIVILIVVMMAPLAFAQQSTISTGCSGMPGTLTTYSGVFYEGETITLTVPTTVTAWSVTTDTTSSPTGDTYTYTIPADGSYSISASVTGGTGDVSASCAESGLDLSKTVDICHRPPGNPEAAHSITVGRAALKAHLAHGDDAGACPPGVETRFEDVGDGLVIFVLPEDSFIVQIYGICVDGNCTLVGLIDLNDLTTFAETATEDQVGQPPLVYDQVTTDDWAVWVHYLGYQSYDGGVTYQHVFQINVMIGTTIWNDDVLIFVADDGSVTWGTND